MLRNKKLIPAEHRKYLRLDTVLPVQFRLEGDAEEIFISAWLQGFTNNIGRGGICLAINNLDERFFDLLAQKKVKLSLEIDLPVSRKPICAKASVVWAKEIFGDKHQYLVGIHYEQILASQNSRLMRYVWVKKLFVPVVLALVLILGFGLGINSYLSFKLTRHNKLLIEKLGEVLEASSTAKQKVEEVVVQRQYFQAKLKALQEQIAQVESQKASIEAGDLKQIQQLSETISTLAQEKLDLEGKLVLVQQKENRASQELILLDKQKLVLEKANFDKMYQWLKIHQNNRTGLVASFEGDKEIANWSFTYDLALLVQAYAYFGDFDRARKILDFFANEAKRENGWFLNAYYVDDGSPAEFVMHAGPNLWLGLAIMQYTHFTQDRAYLGLAQSIAETMLYLQKQDPSGGLRGGPQVSWYSTEHNLDAYAFFKALAEVTQKPLYAAAAEKTLSWIVNNTYNSKDLPVKRGKGDSTIATDTYAWSIAAVGPEKLLELGMNPDQILEFVEENCSVEVNFKHPDAPQTVKIKGFDFAPQRHTARGGVVSSEWTAQMVVSYKIMEEFYLKQGDPVKSASYGNKAAVYLSELGKMIISSASPSGQGEGCLPYATQDQVDTGHGWSTPQGSHTGSVSGTTYTLFAYHGFNPLALKE
jgi:hypothetical protein